LAVVEWAVGRVDTNLSTVNGRRCSLGFGRPVGIDIFVDKNLVKMTLVKMTKTMFDANPAIVPLYVSAMAVVGNKIFFAGATPLWVDRGIRWRGGEAKDRAGTHFSQNSLANLKLHLHLWMPSADIVDDEIRANAYPGDLVARDF
jgi:hypothetical protein